MKRVACLSPYASPTLPLPPTHTHTRTSPRVGRITSLSPQEHQPCPTSICPPVPAPPRLLADFFFLRSIVVAIDVTRPGTFQSCRCIRNGLCVYWAIHMQHGCQLRPDKRGTYKTKSYTKGHGECTRNPTVSQTDVTCKVQQACRVICLIVLASSHALRAPNGRTCTVCTEPHGRVHAVCTENPTISLWLRPTCLLSAPVGRTFTLKPKKIHVPGKPKQK